MAGIVGDISSITLPNGSTYGLKDLTSRQSYVELSAVLSSVQEELRDTSKVFIKDPGETGYEDGKQTDLSVVKLPIEEYAQLVSLSATQPNALYIISSEYEDMFGMQVKNLAAGTDLSDAVTLEQLSNAVSSIDIPNDLSSFTNSPGYLLASQLSALQSISNPKYSVNSICDTLISVLNILKELQ